MIDAAKLSAICERLASSHDGERAVAALKATEMLRAGGETWTGLIQKSFAVAQVKPASRADIRNRAKRYSAPKRTWSRLGVEVTSWIKQIKPYVDELTAWDVDFLCSIERQVTSGSYGGLTEKQWLVLIGIATRVGLITEDM